MNAVGRMSTLFLFFILFANNIMCPNAQPTVAPTASMGPLMYTVTQVSDTLTCMYSIAIIVAVTDVHKHVLISAA